MPLLPPSAKGNEMVEIPIWLIFPALAIAFTAGFFLCDYLGKRIDKSVKRGVDKFFEDTP